jgi:hypothetical protein
MWLGLIASDRKLVPGRSGIVVMSRGVVNDEESAFFSNELAYGHAIAFVCASSHVEKAPVIN